MGNNMVQLTRIEYGDDNKITSEKPVSISPDVLVFISEKSDVEDCIVGLRDTNLSSQAGVHYLFCVKERHNEIVLRKRMAEHTLDKDEED